MLLIGGEGRRFTPVSSLDNSVDRNHNVVMVIEANGVA